MNPNIEKAFHDYEALIAKENQPAAFYNGIYTRYKNPVLTRDHIPPFWKFDLNEETNPLGLERLGVNAVMNSGAIKLNGQYCLVARVEGNDRKSFFAVARSNNPVQGFRFDDYPVILPDTSPEETNVYDMRLTQHEDGYIYGVFCSESKDKTVNDLNNTIAEAQPVVAKLDGAVDELTPALAQMEPLLKSSKTAVDALTSNLVEVEAVVRDISEVTGSMAEASNAVSSVTDSAAGAVQKLFNKVKAPAADADRKLAAAAAEAEQPTERVLIGEDEAAAGDDDGQKSVSKPAQYYTYTPTETSEESCDE